MDYSSFIYIYLGFLKQKIIDVEVYYFLEEKIKNFDPKIVINGLIDY